MAQVTPKQIAAMARARGLDPRAVLAVAKQEGLGGGIGDHGTSFGPFQLHYGGAYPSGAPRGAAASQEWAWSPQGVAYALGQMKGVAGGQRGAQAVKSIVTRFERPADPASEVRGALASFGSAGEGSAPAPALLPTSGGAARGQANPVTGSPDIRHQVALALLQQVGSEHPDYSSVLTLLQAEHAQPTPQPRPSAIPSTSPQPQVEAGPLAAIGGQVGGLNPQFERTLERAVGAAGGTKIRVDSGYRSPTHNAAVGGVPHSNHTTGDAADGSAYVPGKGWQPLGVLLQAVAAKFGLRSGNVPGFYRGGRDPVHVDDGANVRGRR
jgi:hypothetical protein